MTDAVITSAQNAAVKFIRALEHKKHRLETGLFVAEGARALERAQMRGFAPDYVVSAGVMPALGQARSLRVSEAVMARLSTQSNPTGLLGVFKQSLILSPFRPEAHEVALALEGLRDPGNLGTIIRTADAVGVGHVILVGETCDPFSPEAVRATMGSLFGIALTLMPASRFVKLLDEWRGEIVATAANATSDFRRLYQRPTLLLMGSEGSGLSPEIAAKANVSVRIPMPGKAESLNVATASALMLYEIKRLELKLD